MCSVVKQNIHFLGISRFSHSLLLVLLSPVVQFSMINFRRRSLPCAQPWYYTTTSTVCQEVLKKFFEKLFQSLPKGGSVAHYTTSQTVCQEVFKSFLKISFIYDSVAFVHPAEADRRKLDYYITRNRICQAAKANFSLCNLHMIFACFRVSFVIVPFGCKNAAGSI